MIVGIEGIDASGKQTMVKLLKERLAPHFAKVETFDFPHYQGVAGGLVGRILRGETVVATNDQLVPALRHDHLPGLDLPRRHLEKLMASWSLDKALVIQSVMLVDRLQYAEMIQEYTDDDSVLLILDRYYLSGLVYGQADGLDLSWLERIHSTLPRADVFFVLDIPVEESVRRRPDRMDYYEKNLPKLRKVRDLYLDIAEHMDEVVILDGLLAPEITAFNIEKFVLGLRV